jgi:hypothetical protein
MVPFMFAAAVLQAEDASIRSFSFLALAMFMEPLMPRSGQGSELCSETIRDAQTEAARNSAQPPRPQPSMPGEVVNRRQMKGSGTPQRGPEPR